MIDQHGERVPISVDLEELGEVRRPTVGELTELLGRLGGDAGQWAVMKPIPERHLRHIQCFRHDTGEYDVEHLAPGNDQLTTRVADTDTVVGLVLGWRAGDPCWDADHVWRPTGFRPPEPDPIPEDLMPELCEHITADLDQGYWSFDDIRRRLLDRYRTPPVNGLQAGHLIGPLWERRLTEQADWPEVTDCDRLSAAFEALNTAGVTARENFTCCMSCGTHEIGGERRPEDTGYVFFHHQDTELAARQNWLMLAYGDHRGGEDRTVAVGRQVVAALAEQGLTTEWNGRPDQRIGLSLTWRKRIE